MTVSVPFFALGLLTGALVLGVVIGVISEARRRPRWHDDTDETDTLSRMGKALR